jgi:allophanate hydrolase
MALVVCGAHLSGLPLNGQLRARGGRLLQATRSAPHYRLYALADGKRPGMVRDENDGAAIAVEVWELQRGGGLAAGGHSRAAGPGKSRAADGRWLSGLYLRSQWIRRSHGDYRLRRLARLAGTLNYNPSIAF